MPKLSLNDIANIVVNLSPRSAVRKGFNLGLIIGASEVIPPNERVRIYNGVDGMHEDGFVEDMPEYKAASKYFQQAKRPVRIAIGRHNKTETNIDGESVLDAVRACRDKNTDWYMMTYCGADEDDIFQISEYIETAVPSCIYAFTTDDSDAVQGKAR